MNKTYPLLLVILLFMSTKTHSQDREILNDYFGIGISGDSTDVSTPTQFGVVLMGGSTDVDEALQWMIKLSGGGDFIILRASGSTGYNDFIKELGNINSVETLLLDSREKAISKKVGNRIRQAEAVFIAGGDQWNYVNFWSDSEVSAALRYLIYEKKIPIGGTSAGCAVLSGICFDARNDTSLSKEVLLNPFHKSVSLNKSFIEIPILAKTIADQHYSQRERWGRHAVFMARMASSSEYINGIGVDEKTAVCVDNAGNASVYGKGAAYFLVPKSIPEQCIENKPLTWNNDAKAIAVYTFNGSPNGTGAFNLNKWPTEQPHQYWSVEAGILKVTKVK